MHNPVHLFVQSVVEAFDLQGPVYEFGYWQDRNAAQTEWPANSLVDIGYVGDDLHRDAEIDRLEELSSLPYPSQSARTVCCTNVLEHTYEPHRVMDEMLRLLAPGGMFLVCTSMHADRGGSTAHYWQVTPQALERLLHPLPAVLIGWQGPDQVPHTVFAVGCTPPLPVTFLPGIRHFLDDIQQRLDTAAQKARGLGRSGRWLWSWTRSRAERQRESQRHEVHFALHFPMDSSTTLQDILLEDLPPGTDTGTRVDFSS